MIFEKKKLHNIKCVFEFSPHYFPETFLNLRGIERDIIKSYIGVHVKYLLFLSDCNET